MNIKVMLGISIKKERLKTRRHKYKDLSVSTVTKKTKTTTDCIL